MKFQYYFSCHYLYHIGVNAMNAPLPSMNGVYIYDIRL